MTSRLPIGNYLRLNDLGNKRERRKDKRVREFAEAGIVTSSPHQVAVKVGETVRGHAVYVVRRK